MRIKSLELFVLALVLSGTVFLVAFNLPSSSATTNTSTVEIYVNVSVLCQVEASVTSLSWTQVSPGSTGTAQNFDIKNTGSTNLTDIYVSVDVETSRPYGLSASAYEAGSFLVMHNSTDSNFYFVDRREWNLTSKPGGATVQTNAVSWGYFKNTSYEYFWSLVPNTTTNYCNDSGTSLRINTTSGELNAGDSALPCDGLTPGPEYSACSYTSGPLNGYNVLIDKNCNFIQIYKFDYNSSFPVPTTDNREYIHPGILAQGESETVSANVWVPNGIPAGDVSNSTLTITATCA